LTALVLNDCSGAIAGTCEADTGPEGCSSTTIADLIDEVANLIHNGECQQAGSCAAAANEGDALERAAAAGLFSDEPLSPPRVDPGWLLELPLLNGSIDGTGDSSTAGTESSRFDRMSPDSRGAQHERFSRSPRVDGIESRQSPTATGTEPTVEPQEGNDDGQEVGIGEDRRKKRR
jgi:hypothetical protein